MEKILNITNHEVVGVKGILIKLEEYPDQVTTNEAGVIIPIYENYETEGGRPASKITGSMFSNVGTILQISDMAVELLKQDKIDIKVGDRVSIHRNQQHPSNQFLPENMQVVDFVGYVLVSSSMIQSKIK